MSVSICRIAIVLLFLTKINVPSVNSIAITNVNICKITLYTEANFGGTTEMITNNQGNLSIDEHSAKTDGTCCWRIYRYYYILYV